MNVVLNNEQQMPILGLGTWKSSPNDVGEAVKIAIDSGYRHIDCAYLYENEYEVGVALKEMFEQKKLKREDVFITTKLWNTFHKPEDVVPAFKLSLQNLGLEYIDLYLIHVPVGYKNLGSNVYRPKDGNGDPLFDDTDYIDTWKAMEKLLETEKVRSIGVSNFNEYQLKRLLTETTIVPTVNQIECHPYLNQCDMIEFCKLHNVVVVGYSPFGSPDRSWALSDEAKLLEEPVVVDIAKRLEKTTAQVLLRFCTQRGVAVIPKSVTPSRLKSNTEIFDFTISDEDMEKLLKLNRNWRALEMPWDSKHKYYPFRDNYCE